MTETDQTRAESSEEPAGLEDPVEVEAGDRRLVAPRQPEGPDGLRPAHPTSMRLALGSGGVILVVVTALCWVGGMLAVAFAERGPREVVFIASLAFAVPALLAVPLLALPRAHYRRYRWQVDERGVEIHRGIWWRSRIEVPRNRLQHTDVAQGPLERRLGLARLVVYTAGTHNASTTLEALSLEAALSARAMLADHGGDGAGGA